MTISPQNLFKAYDAHVFSHNSGSFSFIPVLSYRFAKRNPVAGPCLKLPGVKPLIPASFPQLKRAITVHKSVCEGGRRWSSWDTKERTKGEETGPYRAWQPVKRYHRIGIVGSRCLLWGCVSVERADKGRRAMPGERQTSDSPPTKAALDLSLNPNTGRAAVICRVPV